jgi:glycosyltransferase involved in cell wall biosynthesis
MKILFNTYPQAFYTPGGGEVQLLKNKEIVEKFGNKVILFNQWDPKLQDLDIVHFFSCQGGSLHFCNFVKNIGLPLVVSPNLWIKEEEKHLYGYEEIRQQLCLSDKIICNSDMECDLLSKTFYLPRERFFTVYNGVDPIFFKPESQEIFRNHYEIYGPFLLNVANIEPRKNQLILAKLIKEFPDLKLVLIGHERDSEYAKRCYEEGGSQIVYLGPLPHNSSLLRSAYSACEAFIFPSTLETPGLAALEALAVGAKVVITSEGSTKEYFGEGVIYVDPKDLKSISTGIYKALGAKKQELSSFYMRVNYTWERVTQDLMSLYRNIVYNDDIKLNFSGFNQIENDPDGVKFAWTKERLDFTMENCLLRFLWHSIRGASVDIYFDQVYIKTVFVGREWQPFELLIKSTDKRKKTNISFVINLREKVFDEDLRVLGVAIRDVLIEYEEDD